MKVILILTFVAVATCTPVELGGLAGYHGQALVHAPIVRKVIAEPVAYPKYQFNYGVKDTHTGDIKEQSEVRDGDVVKGEYSLVEPDGTVRNVKYQADGHNGFNAIVTRTGHAVHPQSATKVAIPITSHGLLQSYH